MFRILDLFCCEGGAALGYASAGFEVVGVDLNPRFRKRYPFEFHSGDALGFVKEHGAEFDAIHASPPCQAYSITKNTHSKHHPELIEPAREALQASGKPYIIENVVGAPLIDPVLLCWGMFFDAGSVIDEDGVPLRMERHRLFETNWGLQQPCHPAHDRSVWVGGSYGGTSRTKYAAKFIRKGGYVPSKVVQEKLLGIHHMTLHGLHQSIPPAYTEYVGSRLINYLESDDV